MMMNLRSADLGRPLLLSPVVVRLPTVLFRLVALLVLGCAAGTANAAESTEVPKSLTAAEFLSRVEKSSPQLERLQGDIAQESAAVTAAGIRSNPTVAYEREQVFAGSRSYPENVFRLELPLEISGRRALRVEGAERGVEAARKTAARDKQWILLGALDVYLRAASMRLKLEVLRAESSALGRLVEAVKSRTAAGDTSGYDLDRLAIEAEALDDLVASADRELLAGRRALGLLAGDSTAQFDASDDLALPALAGDATSNISALAAHPSYSTATLRVQQAEAELRAADRGWIPSLSVTAGAKSARIDTDTHWGYVAGLALSLPVLDYGQADADKARARLRSARADQRLIEQQVLVQTTTGTESIALIVGQARQFEETQTPRLTRLVRRAETSYQEGERPVFELLDAYRTARGVRLRAIELRLQARLTEVELWRARGLGPGGNP